MRYLHRRPWHWLFAVLLVTTGTAHAALTIEISQGVEGALPIAVVPFGAEGMPPQEDIAAIVAADLRRSGQFAPLPPEQMLERPAEGGQVNFQNWRVLGVDDVVVGKVRPGGDGGYVVQFQLLDVFKGTQLAGYTIPARTNELRRVAHYISDLVYEQLTGQPGVFNTRIAYITATRTKPASYALMVADADGFNSQTILRSKQPLMSPTWSPDGTRLAYVSFEKGRSQVFIQEVSSGARNAVASFEGINGSPAFSPDGQRLALTLSRDGNPDIYTMNLSTKLLQRLTNSSAIDTEATWAPDGRSIVFTSDRGGKPQLYQVPAEGGAARRITFDGDYNARGEFSPRGDQIAMVHQVNGRFVIAVMDLKTHLLRVLTDGALDESPSFAPNGSMILYATEDAGRGVLAAVSVDGRVRQRLVLEEGDVREPAWGPTLR